MHYIAKALDLPQSRSVKELNLTQTGISFIAFKKILESLKKNATLKILIVDRNNLGTPYISSTISGVISSISGLQELSCKNCNLTDTFGT